jgi:hypothetical protein
MKNTQGGAANHLKLTTSFIASSRSIFREGMTTLSPALRRATKNQLSGENLHATMPNRWDITQPKICELKSIIYKPFCPVV